MCVYGAWMCSCVCAGAPIQAGVEANGLTLERFLQSLLHLTSRKIYFAVIVCKELHAHEYRCHQRSKTVPPGLGVTHSWQLPSVGDGPQTQVLSHSTWVISPALPPYLWVNFSHWYSAQKLTRLASQWASGTCCLHLQPWSYRQDHHTRPLTQAEDRNLHSTQAFATWATSPATHMLVSSYFLSFLLSLCVLVFLH